MAHNGKDLYKRDPLPVTNPHEGMIPRFKLFGDRIQVVWITGQQAEREEREKRMVAKAFREMDRSK